MRTFYATSLPSLWKRRLTNLMAVGHSTVVDKVNLDLRNVRFCSSGDSSESKGKTTS